ncbi:hypothetical protein KY347_05425 [Candidatus Woesearchaeota archaeon]|nr:hypothetical protein [Candidatus Woesearchaeota archaeon]
MPYYGEVNGRLIAKKGLARGACDDHQRHEDISKILDEAGQEVKSCLENVLTIEGITEAGQSRPLKDCYFGLASYWDAFLHTGRIGSPLGVFDMHVTGETKKAVEFALYFIDRYLWIEDSNTKVKKI